ASVARQAAQFHDSLPPITDDKSLGTPEAVYAAMQENFDQVRPLLTDKALLTQLDALEDWTRTTFERHRELIASRRANGLVREWHRDLHLANITAFNDLLTGLDCIEFNERFRWIDVIHHRAFLLMDVDSRSVPALANLVLNTYLENGDDF